MAHTNDHNAHEQTLTSKFIYVFDGECAMCSRFVQFLVRHDRNHQFWLATAQSDIGRQYYFACGLDADEMETALLVTGDRTYTHLDVFTESLVRLGWPWKAAVSLRALPRPLANWIYRRIANNRRRLNGAFCALPNEDVKGRLLD